MYIRIFRYLASLRGQTLEQIEEDRLPEPGCPVERMQVCNDKASENTGEASGAGTDQNKLSVPQAGAGTPRGLLCGAGRMSFTIDWKGRMVPCGMMGMITADPLETGFLPAWKSINQAANSWPTGWPDAAFVPRRILKNGLTHFCFGCIICIDFAGVCIVRFRQGVHERGEG